jgi:hypothetical protein
MIQRNDKKMGLTRFGEKKSGIWLKSKKCCEKIQPMADQGARHSFGFWALPGLGAANDFSSLRSSMTASSF